MVLHRLMADNKKSHKNLQKSVCILIMNGHVNAWDYGMGFFQTALEVINKAKK